MIVPGTRRRRKPRWPRQFWTVPADSGTFGPCRRRAVAPIDWCRVVSRKYSSMGQEGIASRTAHAHNGGSRLAATPIQEEVSIPREVEGVVAVSLGASQGPGGGQCVACGSVKDGHPDRLT